MPPVRWKLSIVTTVCLLQAVSYTDGQVRQDEVSTDGWKPIVGTRNPNFYESFSTDSNEFYKYDSFSTPPPTVTTAPSTTTPGSVRKPVFRGPPKLKPIYQYSGRKIPHQKHIMHPNPFFALPTHEHHGPHIPLGAVVHTRPSQIGLIKQHASSTKPLIQVTPTNKRNVKPVRVQTSTNNYRDDIFTASATSGNYLYKNHGSNIRTRETLDLGLPGANHYSIGQPHGHIEFSNRFALPSPNSGSVFEQYNNPPIPAFVFGKPPQSNDINYQIQNQNDEFTRNLIPPPQVYKNKEAVNRVKPNVHENVVLQIPPTYPFTPQKIEEPQVQVQVTKENLHEFHNNIPPNYHGQYVEYGFSSLRKPTAPPQYDLSGVTKPTAASLYDSDVKKPTASLQYDYSDFSDVRKPTDTAQFDSSKIRKPILTYKNDFSKVRNPTVISEYDFSKVGNPTEASKPVYEVTESNLWQETPSLARIRQPIQVKRRPNFDEDLPVFLPTPYLPEKPSVEPTSPTQSEVSTIFTKLSKLQKEKEVTTPNPFSFNAKEVSTHYPIFGKPIFNDVHSSQEISNEITTLQEEVVTTTPEPQRIKPQRRRRPDRRRTTTTTTQSPDEDFKKMEENESQNEESERPIRTKRPNRYRTTTPSTSDEETLAKINRGRNRYRHRNTENLNYEPTRIRTRPRVETTTLHTESEKPEEEYYQESSQQSSVEVQEAASERSEEIEESPNSETVEVEVPEHNYATEAPKNVRYETIRPFIIITTTEKVPTTNLVIPENEVDDVTLVSTEETTTTTTTAAPTTTTATTANPYRIKTRPIKFDNSHRPRFSVKDYRQKLYQQSTTSTPEPHKTTESVRIRMPSRLRRPSTTASTNNYEEESTDPIRSKFVPKDPRHHSTTENTNVGIITEKNIKSVNTRLRPFGRYKSTTAPTTTTPKVSIKPNLFNRKRPTMLTLRGKIFNKYQRNNTEPTTEKVTTTEEYEENETTEESKEEQEVAVASTTDSSLKNVRTTEEHVDVETTTMGDISKIDPYFYSQRVSDLTSSAKNDYNTPGLFKSVSPTSRRIPNYFTIATDDPILPIEAFFPSLKERNRDS